MTLALHLETQLYRAMKRCAKQQQVCLQYDSPDAVHEMRVSCRRILEPLRVFDEVLRRAPIQPVRDTLRAWMRLSGRVRDLDIAIHLASESGVAGLHPLLASMEEQRRKLAEKAHRTMAEPIPWPRKRDLRGWVRSSKSSNKEGLWDLDLAASSNGVLVLPMLLQRYRLRGNALLSTAAAREDFHRFRLRTKRLRYATEWFAVLLPKCEPVRLLDQLKGFQQCLGDLQDTEVALALLSRAHKGESTDDTSARAVSAFLNARADEAVARFHTQWVGFAATTEFPALDASRPH
ncbi:MAG: CHAD domain-containing protein [Bryobacterales bacterium]|jgi:CHAD domain-containing protein|nr:CHAD domain-containing protein [Bryobacterales bacterium]